MCFYIFTVTTFHSNLGRHADPGSGAEDPGAGHQGVPGDPREAGGGVRGREQRHQRQQGPRRVLCYHEVGSLDFN